MLFLPAAAIAALAAQKGIRRIVTLGLLCLASTGAAGYVAFCLWFLSRRIVRPFSIAVVVASVVCLILVIPKLTVEARAALRGLAVPALSVLAAALLVVAAGFVYGGMDRPLLTPADRFSHHLPGDNMLPFQLAEIMMNGETIRRRFDGDWQSSDRPPLETGMALAQYPFLFKGRPLAYTVLSAVAQSLWIFGLWLLLTALECNCRAVAWTLVVTTLSGFVFINTFFVWPKLLAAAYALGWIAFLLSTPLRNRAATVAAGLLLALSLLAHGGTVFLIPGPALALPALRKRISFRAIVLMLAVALALYLPWVGYQTFYDPPGDRLIKWHIGGVEKVDGRSAWQAIHDSYSELNRAQLWNNKLSNFTVAFDYQGGYWERVCRLITARANRAGLASELRVYNFFYFAPSLGFLIFGVPAAAIGTVSRRMHFEWRASVRLFSIVLLTAITWCLLMFGPNSTTVHQGPYAMVLMAYAATVLGLWSISSILAYVVGGLQIAFSFVLYVLLMRPVNAGPVCYPIAVLALASLLALVFLLHFQRTQPSRR